jgi:hypothetical protein
MIHLSFLILFFLLFLSSVYYQKIGYIKPVQIKNTGIINYKTFKHNQHEKMVH